MKIIYLLTFFVFSIMMISFASAIEITTCQTLNIAGATYTLQNDIVTTGTCFTITADNITLDGNGFTIDGDDSGIDRGVYSYSKRYLVIKNFKNITDFYYGIEFNSADSSIIMNNTISSASRYGLYLWNGANYNIVMNNTINLNYMYGLVIRGVGNKITNNIIVANTIGVVFFIPSLDNQLLNNKITNSSSSTISDSSGHRYINYLIYNNSFGEIRWIDTSSGGFLKDMDLIGNIDLGTNLDIGNNTAYLNASAFTLGLINSSADITLYGIDSFGFTDNLQILRDGIDCGSDCVNFTPLNAATVKFNVTYAGANYSINGTSVLDSDNDGIEDSLDICPNTELPEIFELLPNHFGDIDGDGIFEKLIVKKKNEREIVDSEFTLEDTSGCSCNQILEIKPGKNIGESLNGCTKGTIIAFVKHNFSGGILTGLSFVVTGFFGDFKDSISGMITGKLFKLQLF